jgi:hypothetical protein
LPLGIHRYDRIDSARITFTTTHAYSPCPGQCVSWRLSFSDFSEKSEFSQHALLLLRISAAVLDFLGKQSALSPLGEPHTFCKSQSSEGYTARAEESLKE